jgi:hypothetical protein
MTAPASPNPSDVHNFHNDNNVGTGGLATLSATWQVAGDIAVLLIDISSSSNAINTVTSSKVTLTGWTKRYGAVVPGSGTRMEIWTAQVLSTGADTINLTYTGSMTGIASEASVDTFKAGFGANTIWTIQSVGAINNSTSPTVTFPTLTSLPVLADPIYCGLAYIDSASGTGVSSPAAFTPGIILASANLVTYGINLTANTAYTPIGSASATTPTQAVAIMFRGSELI